MKGIFVAIILFISFAGSAQPVLSVDKTEVRIGDQLKATIRADVSNGKEWTNLKRIWPDTITGIEVIGEPELTSTHPEAYTATWTIAVFDTGVVIIPQLPVVIKSPDRTDTFYTIDIPVKVLTVEPDSTGIAGIKDIYAQPFSPGYYKKYIPHIVLFLIVIAALVVYLRQRQSKRVPVEPAPIPLWPHEWALKALDELAEKKLWQRGEVKEHYSELTGILREYLERRYAIHAKEQTSDEILAQLRRLQLKPALLYDTEELISIADLIKFAKADPGMNIHAAAIERVRAFIAETIPQVQLVQEEPSNPGDHDVAQ